MRRKSRRSAAVRRTQPQSPRLACSCRSAVDITVIVWCRGAGGQKKKGRRLSAGSQCDAQAKQRKEAVTQDFGFDPDRPRTTANNGRKDTAQKEGPRVSGWCMERAGRKRALLHLSPWRQHKRPPRLRRATAKSVNSECFRMLMTARRWLLSTP